MELKLRSDKDPFWGNLRQAIIKSRSRTGQLTEARALPISSPELPAALPLLPERTREENKELKTHRSDITLSRTGT